MPLSVGIVALTTLVSATTAQVLAHPTLWTLQADGRTCAELSSEARRLFGDWHLDRDNTVDAEEVWGLYNPAAPNQLVVLYGSRANCKEISDAIRQETPLAPQIAWGKAKEGLRIGIAVANVHWRAPADRVLLLRVQRIGKRAISLKAPATGKKGNVGVWVDGDVLPRGQPRRHGKARELTLGPGEVQSVTLDLSDESLPPGQHELSIVFEGRRSGRLTIVVEDSR